MERKLYELVITEDEQSGVDFVALVDRPAIEHNWHAFKSPEQFKVVSEERRIVMGPLMVPNQPIFRKDKGEPYYVVFSEDTIQKIAKRFMRKGFTANVNQMHNARMVADKCYMIESFMVDETRGIHTPDKFATMPNGTWFGTYAIENDKIWQKVKSGEFQGFSVEGIFEEIALASIEEKMIEELIEALTYN